MEGHVGTSGGRGGQGTSPRQVKSVPEIVSPRANSESLKYVTKLSNLQNDGNKIFLFKLGN